MGKFAIAAGVVAVLLAVFAPWLLAGLLPLGLLAFLAAGP